MGPRWEKVPVSWFVEEDSVEKEKWMQERVELQVGCLYREGRMHWWDS